MGMDAISRIEAGERKYKPQINHLTFADGFNNFINNIVFLCFILFNFICFCITINVIVDEKRKENELYSR